MTKQRLHRIALILTGLFAVLAILVITENTIAWDRSVNQSIANSLSL